MCLHFVLFRCVDGARYEDSAASVGVVGDEVAVGEAPDAEALEGAEVQVEDTEATTVVLQPEGPVPAGASV